MRSKQRQGKTGPLLSSFPRAERHAGEYLQTSIPRSGRFSILGPWHVSVPRGVAGCDMKLSDISFSQLAACVESIILVLECGACSRFRSRQLAGGMAEVRTLVTFVALTEVTYSLASALPELPPREDRPPEDDAAHHAYPPC